MLPKTGDISILVGARLKFFTSGKRSLNITMSPLYISIGLLLKANLLHALWVFLHNLNHVSQLGKASHGKRLIAPR